MKIFFGAAIQGASNREERAAVHRLIINALKNCGCIEVAHAYLRPRLVLTAIPVFALYQKNYWPNNLSTMIRGITKDEVSNFVVKEYDEPGNAAEFIPKSAI